MKFVKNPNITHGTIAVAKVLCALQSRGQTKASYQLLSGRNLKFGGRVLSETSAVRRLTECIEKVMLHCFISRYKQLSALTRTMDHQRLGSAT